MVELGMVRCSVSRGAALRLIGSIGSIGIDRGCTIPSCARQDSRDLPNVRRCVALCGVAHVAEMCPAFRWNPHKLGGRNWMELQTHMQLVAQL